MLEVEVMERYIIEDDTCIDRAAKCFVFSYLLLLYPAVVFFCSACERYGSAALPILAGIELIVVLWCLRPTFCGG